jgi:hypothetical protein
VIVLGRNTSHEFSLPSIFSSRMKEEQEEKLRRGSFGKADRLGC